jgi:hypothetical protein
MNKRLYFDTELKTELILLEDKVKPIETNLTDIKHNGKIFALSDIHGDLHSFIIALRDCAKVIKKIVNIDLTKEIDSDIEKNLIIDISNDDNGYDESIGYTWCGENSYIVICGDIIDPNRSNTCININSKQCSEYPQIEIKLLRFINEINHQAMKENGKIIKLLGNHELSAILSISLLQYAYTSDIIKSNYYRGIKRSEIFYVGNHGFDLLFKDDCRILIKINNTIFVHGQLPKFNISKIEEINQFLNNRNNHNNTLQTLWSNKLNNYNNGEGPLWDRKWASSETIHDRINDGIQDKFCEDNVKKDLINFLGTTDIDKLRVVLGHCVQKTSRKNLINTTMIYKMYNDKHSKRYSSKEYYTGKITESNQDTIFGITMQCPKPIDAKGHTDFYVYHVDIGASRGFDPNYHNINSIYTENKYLFSKTPQILSIEQIDGNDFITIIKSKMINTRIHLPRPNYEELIKTKNITGLKLDSGNYDKKYQKYKHKYLKLKYEKYKQKYLKLKFFIK